MGGGLAARLNNLRIETVGTEEAATEQLEAVLETEVEEEREDLVDGKEEGVETQRALGALKFLTQDADPIRKTLIDSRNGFNELSRLAMMWNVWHR